MSTDQKAAAPHSSSSGLPTTIDHSYSTNPSLSSPSALAQRVWELLMWEDVVSSAVAFASGLLVVLLVQVGGYTLLSLVSYALLVQLLVCFIYINGIKLYMSMKGQPVPQMDDPVVVEVVSREVIDSYITFLHDTINQFINSLAKVIHCRDNYLTLKVMGGLALLAVFGRLFEGLTLIGIGHFFAFSVPKVYLLNKEVVDAKLLQAKHLAFQYGAIIANKLPLINKEKAE